MNTYILYWLDDTTDIYFYSVFSKEKEAVKYQKALAKAFPKISIELEARDFYRAIDFLYDLNQIGSVSFAKEKVKTLIEDYWGTVEKIIEFRNKYIPHKGRAQ